MARRRGPGATAPPPPPGDWAARRAYDTGWQRCSTTPATPGSTGRPSTAAGACRRPSSSSTSRSTPAPSAPYVGINFVGIAARRADADRRGHRRAARVPPAPDPPRRDGVVPGLLRARGRLRPRVAAHPRRARRRRVRRHRPEDLEHPGPRRRLVRAAGAHRPRRAEAQGHHLADPRHAPARRRGPADADHRRREPLLRGLPRRGPGPGHQPGRRGERRLAGHQRDAALRAGHRVRPAHHHVAVPAPAARRAALAAPVRAARWDDPGCAARSAASTPASRACGA